MSLCDYRADEYVSMPASGSLSALFSVRQVARTVPSIGFSDGLANASACAGQQDVLPLQ